MIESPKPIYSYGKVTKRNAEKFFADCMSVKDSRIEWIRDVAISQGVPKHHLDLTKESLYPLWSSISKYVEFSSKKIQRDKINNGELPEWFVTLYDAIGHESYSDRSLWILDGLAYYLGETFIRSYDHISWQLIISPRYEMSGMPHIVSSEWDNFRFCPWQQVRTAMGGTSIGTFTPDANFFSTAFIAMIKLGNM